jgi:Glycosyl transferase family 2
MDVSVMMNVSVIMPAYNAAKTIAETIATLQAQTFPHWQLIVVDDGSMDETAVIVHKIADGDGRIQLIQQKNVGGSAARNTGIAHAQHDWILFFDADDWLEPTHLQQMTVKLAANPELDAVTCGWTRVSPDGEVGRADFAPDLPDLFPTFAEECAFLIHTCVLRREAVQAVGGFDTSLKTCQDWDFWQRIARLGTQFGSVRQVLARYRSRPGSVSLNGTQQLQDSLRVISQAYQADPRVAHPHPTYQDGLPSSGVAQARIRFACWSFGLVLGVGEDARPLLQLLAGDIAPELDPEYVAACFFEAGLLPQGLSLSSGGWDSLWPQVEPLLTDFLAAFETHTQAPDLARRTLRFLADKILIHSYRQRPLTIGHTLAMTLEVTRPFTMPTIPANVHYLRCEVQLEGDFLGAVTVDVDEDVQTAVAREFAWPILGRYFAYHIFPQLQHVTAGKHTSLWRNDVCLATVPPPPDDTFWQTMHNEAGWTLLLQTIWNRPTWPHPYFYDLNLVEPAHNETITVKDSFVVRHDAPIPNLHVQADELQLTWMMGETAVTQLTFPVTHNPITAQHLRVAVTEAAGFDLCLAFVRAYLLERELGENS